MIINTILVFYAIKKLDADSSKQVRLCLLVLRRAIPTSCLPFSHFNICLSHVIFRRLNLLIIPTVVRRSMNVR